MSWINRAHFDRANLKATAILSQRETWVRAVSVVAWPQYTQDFLNDQSGLTKLKTAVLNYNSFAEAEVLDGRMLLS